MTTGNGVRHTNGHANGDTNKKRPGLPAAAEVTRLASSRLPTLYGEFDLTAYQDQEGKEHLMLVMGDVWREPSLARIHSECLTGDALGSIRCDCGEQLQRTMQYIAAEGRGILLYLRQEGRGIGLGNKVRAYALQDQGLDTVEANLHLGLPVDGRRYRIAAAMLRDQGVQEVRLLTNNPRKVADLEDFQVRVVERVAHQMPARDENRHYLEIKARKMGHLFPALL
jgi:GTP cyclohydrolase II